MHDTYPVTTPHPDGSTITAAADMASAVVYVADPGDVAYFQAWADERRTLGQNWARRTGRASSLPLWQITVDPDRSTPTHNPLTLMETP